MKFYHIKNEKEISQLNNKEKCFVVCDKENFKSVYRNFSIIQKEEHSIEQEIDLIHFESHFDYDVISFSFFEWKEDGLVFEKVHLYFSKQFIIFVCDQNELLFDQIMKTVEEDKDIQPNGIDTLTYIYYKTIDYILSLMFLSLETFEEEIVKEELCLLNKDMDNEIEIIIEMKSISFEVKRKLRLLSYIGDQIVNNDNKLVASENLKYFRNISIRMNRLLEFGSSLHEKTDHLMDIYNTSLSDRSNNFLNKLTIVSFFATPITVLSGIYGMNFVNMPELQMEYAYFILLAIIFVVLLGIYVFLKRSKML